MEKILLMLHVLLTFYVTGSTPPLNVLIVSTPLLGHASRPLALGEELAIRGHNVSFCSVDSFMNIKNKVIERGMNYISAGKLDGNETEQRKMQLEVLKHHEILSKSFSLTSLQQCLLLTSSLSGISIFTDYFLEVDFQQWNIVIFETFLFHSLPCIVKKSNISTIGLSSYIFKDIQPWATPQSSTTRYSSNVDFTKRIVLSTILPIINSFFHLIFSVNIPELVFGSELTRPLCKEVFNWYPHEGWEYPLIFTTVMGLEYPRTVSPMVNYVGPVLSQSAINQSLPEDINQWIQDKKEHSVIYISMGSFAGISRDVAEAIINGIKDSNYSVIWSLNKNSRIVISNLMLDMKKYFISSWIPQVRLLQHNSISMAILHGGSNGVHEALYYGIPCIILPQFGDQFDWGVRVADAGVGVQLLPHEVTSGNIKESIDRIGSGEYRNKAQKMKMIMRRGGGVKKAADLVEYYGVVGYDHLLAAPIKYKWNWIQYYNVDVCITLMFTTLAIMWSIVMVIRYSCRCCYRLLFNEKIKLN